MEVEIDFFPYFKKKYQGKIKLNNITTELKFIDLPKFEINQKKALIDEKYKFIDLDKLLKLNGKKYTSAELKDIALKIGVPANNKKLELVRLIKLKIGIE